LDFRNKIKNFRRKKEMEFMNAIESTLNSRYNVSVTENGAVGYRTTGKELLDLNFTVASLRKMSDKEVAERFIRAFCEDKILAMKWLFYARDVREGLGERRLFRVVLAYLVESNPEMVIPVINLIPEYGRYDDLWCLLDNPKSARVVYQIVDAQLRADLKGMTEGRPISLLAKWMPSCNASNAKTKAYSIKLRKALYMHEREYRKTLVALRKYLDVVEVKMSGKNWSEIKYEAVPSRANLIYNSAFLRNDEERRRDYLGKLEKGETKINASTLFPHDIVNKYTYGGHHMTAKDATIEALWKALPDMVQGCGNTIVVADGSGSMTTRVDAKSSVSALDVANALAIYFAERSSGQFKDKYITFSERPQFVDFSKCDSLHAKLQTARAHNEVANTNIEKVFDMILTTAVINDLPQEDLPANILIISDMEFDSCATTGEPVRRHGYWGDYWDSTRKAPTQTLFDTIARKYDKCGYKMPRLVFWNVNSRTGTIPVKENDLGVALVSGFSVNVAKMVMSGKTDPFECLLETLNSERYDAVENALRC
jgi:hypothetical protein